MATVTMFAILESMKGISPMAISMGKEHSITSITEFTKVNGRMVCFQDMGYLRGLMAIASKASIKMA